MIRFLAVMNIGGSVVVVYSLSNAYLLWLS
jgi:hypothetical protein